MSEMSDEQMSKFPALQIVFLIIPLKATRGHNIKLV